MVKYLPFSVSCILAFSGVLMGNDVLTICGTVALILTSAVMVKLSYEDLEIKFEVMQKTLDEVDRRVDAQSKVVSDHNLRLNYLVGQQNPSDPFGG